MTEKRTFSAGALDCVLVADGRLPYPPAILLGSAPPNELERALPGEIDADGTIVGRFNPLLVRGSRDLAVEDGLLVAGYHVRGAGRVERRDTAFGIVYEAT